MPVVRQMLTCCSHVATCWERVNLLALLYVMFSCIFVTFQYDVLGQVWYLIVLIPDLCLLPYFYLMHTYAKFDQNIPCGSRDMNIFLGFMEQHFSWRFAYMCLDNVKMY